MKIDAELMVECLIYLNVFYYPLFFICEIILVSAKWQSTVQTPNIDRDVSVVFAVLAIEMLKILLFRNFKDSKKDLITGIVVLLTLFTIAGCVYILSIQEVRLETILSAIMIMLAVTEVAFGAMQILPCFKKVQYY